MWEDVEKAAVIVRERRQEHEDKVRRYNAELASWYRVEVRFDECGKSYVYKSKEKLEPDLFYIDYTGSVVVLVSCEPFMFDANILNKKYEVKEFSGIECSDRLEAILKELMKISHEDENYELLAKYAELMVACKDGQVSKLNHTPLFRIKDIMKG